METLRLKTEHAAVAQCQNVAVFAYSELVWSMTGFVFWFSPILFLSTQYMQRILSMQYK